MSATFGLNQMEQREVNVRIADDIAQALREEPIDDHWKLDCLWRAACELERLICGERLSSIQLCRIWLSKAAVPVADRNEGYAAAEPCPPYEALVRYVAELRLMSG